PDAAALRDILRVLTMRWALVDVILFPTLVQGGEAPLQIVGALAAANEYSRTIAPLDTLIVARGGGSIEDLWAFNDERVALAIVESGISVVTGIGHETDFTIADFVADLRAPTPSAAAAAVVPDRAELIDRLTAVQVQLIQQALEQVDLERQHVHEMRQRLQRIDPRRQLDARRQSVDDRERRLQRALQRRLERSAERQAAARLRLGALNPTDVLRRGYSIVQRSNGQVITTPAMLQPGETLLVQAAGGAYQVQNKA
ncbi:MAG: exodeoxyribonuclease VII large subunit, partial [Chloroflexota bacterium]|nr:exodeoxyribonuclease VII large subunit [Chloroflexota bacterium]